MMRRTYARHATAIPATRHTQRYGIKFSGNVD